MAINQDPLSFSSLHYWALSSFPTAIGLLIGADPCGVAGQKQIHLLYEQSIEQIQPHAAKAKKSSSLVQQVSRNDDDNKDDYALR